jgi:MazG family protein
MQENSALGRSMTMVRDLRLRCAWDRAQTRDTLRPYLVEEVHELDQALGSGDPAAIRSEIADLLLHLAWQLVLAEERQEFSPDDAAGDLEAKMKRRHPHLFDRGPQEKWETLKREERRLDVRRAGRPGVLDGLPPTLPDLLMAYRLQERAAGVGFDWPDSAGPAAKVREELVEVEAEIGAGIRSDERLDHEIGDLLFSVVNLARKAGVHPGPALSRANQRFRQRFGEVARLAEARGIDLHTAGLEVLDRLWDEVKERGGGESPA